MKRTKILKATYEIQELDYNVTSHNDANDVYHTTIFKLYLHLRFPRMHVE